ncbi:MAG: ParB/RepB/Spo0J family partition protein [Actinobacteria bacterium]|nr:ParB/RepB/Spo0J family partition protein [Acidimicrobiia bacterium]MCA1734744.1 ParB/RepB/Spo0J family partition protein [Actinomycetota bacterium]MDQ3501620.1 ParB/RepB/Spo0J family partition protein [Actinomycetota bacterium]
MTVKRGLGRGLESLIPVGLSDDAGFAHIELGQIRPNPHQPRSSFDEEALEGLADSIRSVGVLQPVVVRPDPEGGYFLVAGERRWRAARRAGLTQIPAVIRSGEDAAWLTEALVENLQRSDLTPLEEAAAFRQLLEDFGLTHDEVALRVGKSRATVTNSMRLLGLPASIQARLESGELSAGHARALAGVDDRAFAEHVARRAVAEGWSVRQVEEAVRLRKGESTHRPRAREVRPAEIIELEMRLADRLDSRVKVEFKSGRGAVHIDYRSLEDLERLYRRLMT